MRVGSGIATVAVALALLAGCAPAPESSPDPAPTAAGTHPAVTPTPDATAVAHEFRMPTRCAQLLTADTASRFAAAGLELLGGPEGRYGDAYFADPTPEQRAGGITCVWGDEQDLASTVIVSVAPVSTATRAGIVRDLIAQGLNEAHVDGALTYAQIGDETSTAGVLNVVRTDSWISVLEAVGGVDRFQHATELVDEVTAQVYVAP